MLKLKIRTREDFNDDSNEFVEEFIEIELEHSLASMSKWEEIWEIPLLSTKEKTEEQNISYLQCMCLTPDVPLEVFHSLDENAQAKIADYLNKKNTATWFANEPPQAKSGEALTAELIYYWMNSFNIDWEAQYWPINKLLTLVKVHSVKQDNKPRQQSSRSRKMDLAAENARRRAELGTNG